MDHRDMSAPDLERRDQLGEDASKTNRVRQGVTGHGVRYVLIFGIAGVVLCFVLVYAAFFG
jgi:hypothetical protein